MSIQANGKQSGRVDYETPDFIVDRCRNAFEIERYELDVAASRQNAKAPCYFTEAVNGLAQGWWGDVWCNPPWGRTPTGTIGDWFRRAHEMTRGAGKLLQASSVTLLVPANNLDAHHWHQVVFNHGAHEIHFHEGRISFLVDGVPMRGNAVATAAVLFRAGRPPKHPRIESMSSKP